MLSPRRLVEKARKGIFYSTKADAHAASSSHVCTTMVADKGHFIAYTEDGARFMVPIAFLGSPLFQELLNASEDEFGLIGDRPITLPCDASFMQEVLTLEEEGEQRCRDQGVACLTWFIPLLSIHFKQCSM